MTDGELNADDVRAIILALMRIEEKLGSRLRLARRLSRCAASFAR